MRIPAATLVASLSIILPVGPSAAQTPLDETTLPTRAEATDWIETSRYDDVVALLETVAAARADAHLTTMGYTFEGRAIPLLVVGLGDPSAESVMASGKLRVYLQGGIHSGEVPGKEALQMLARDLAAGRAPAAWTESMVLLIAPLYNADGNERVRLTNRPRQHGPLAGMGQRPNAMGLDLNRDHMKLDSPEARSVVGMMNRYDPHLSVDLHTTNGSRHGYHLTYSPPLHPGVAAPVVDLLRGSGLPQVTEGVFDRTGWHTWYYGNARRMPDGETGWFTFDHRPRFNNNYIGLRNRLAILGEAYSYATFEDRVIATRVFVDEILDWAASDTDAIRDAVAAADASAVGEVLPTRATFAADDTLATILMGEVDEERNPWSGRMMLRRRDVTIPTPMREYGTFAATDTETVPRRYYVPPNVEPAIDRLAAHGIEATVLSEPLTVEVEEFRVDSTSVSPREFQGHNEIEYFGSWTTVERTLPAGTHAVDVAQPLGRLAFYLLEPRSDDGLANWAFMDEFVEEGVYPIVREPGR
ncbi:MAG: M14 family metallopeptidase [Gemmatimonadetes bacterium]|nr:M14 family metallopeptidase [Gemmatimonadota bacterium]